MNVNPWLLTEKEALEMWRMRQEVTALKILQDKYPTLRGKQLMLKRVRVCQNFWIFALCHVEFLVFDGEQHIGTFNPLTAHFQPRFDGIVSQRVAS
jgi:hypothetical protein